MEVPVNTSLLLEPTRLPERAEMASGSCAADGRMKPEAFVSVTGTGEESSTLRPTGWLSALKAQALPLAVLSLVVNLIFISVLIARPAKTCEPCSVAACPYGWVGYLGKCYYFSKLQANWTESQKNCSALGASLAGIDSQQEMDFLGLNTRPFDRWIGLHKEQDQTWKWSNGTDFNKWFPVAGEEQCAFLYHNGDASVASSSCRNSQHWICSKPAQNPKGEMK